MCTVIFDKNGGDTDASPATETVACGGSLGTLPEMPARAGYTFTGWNTQAGGGGSVFTAATVVTADITVYAQWTPVKTQSVSYTVTYSGNNSTGGSAPTDSTFYPEGAAVIRPQPGQPDQDGRRHGLQLHRVEHASGRQRHALCGRQCLQHHRQHHPLCPVGEQHQPVKGPRNHAAKQRFHRFADGAHH